MTTDIAQFATIARCILTGSGSPGDTQAILETKYAHGTGWAQAVTKTAVAA